MAELEGEAKPEGGLPSLLLPRLMYGTLSLERLSPGLGGRLVHAAIDHGLSALDTAPLYGLGVVEQIIGAAIRDRRERVQIATKCGIRWDQDHGAPLFEADVAGSFRTFRANGLPASIRHEVHASLERLGVETIDLIQLHQFDELVPLADTLGELHTLQREGKVRAIGVSNFPLRALERAAGLESGRADGTQLFSTQDEYNAVERRVESTTLAFARTSGIHFLAYSPLAGGALSGRYLALAGQGGVAAPLPLDYRKDAAVFAPENLARINAALTSVAVPLAREHAATLSQLGLAWVLSRPGVSAALVGGSSEAQIHENAAALELTIGAEQMAELDRVLEAAAPPPPEPSLFGRMKATARRALSKVRR